MYASDPATQPVEITMDRPGERVEIVWGDGHRSPLRYPMLRKSCPCAECRELRAQAAAQAAAQPAGGLRVLPANAARSTRPDLADLSLVGRYALQLVWSDGHDTGIYTFRMLRDLCECDECRTGG